MNDRSVRVCYLLSLTCLVAFILPLSMFVVGHFGIGGINTAHAACIAFTEAAILGIWRKHVYWTNRRAVSTTALTVGVLVFMKVMFLMQADFLWGKNLVFGQALFLLGIWIAGCCWIWWKELLIASVVCPVANRLNRSFIMSPDAARLAISGALIPLLPGIFYLAWGITAIGMRSPRNLDEILWASMQACSVAGIGLWLVLWRKHVVWTSRRKRVTAVLAAFFLLSPLSALIPRGTSPFDLVDVSVFLASLRYGVPFLAAAAWFGGTARVWRSAPLPMANEPDAIVNPFAAHCPKCSYNLTGLREVRCPECGWASTIDDIVNRTLAEWSAVAGGSV